MTVTSDISKFGSRERAMAAKLLESYGSSNDKTSLLNGSVNVFLNTMSGFVFLSDDDFNVGMMSGDLLEDYITCPNCGNEGFLSDFKDENEDSQCCQDYSDELNDILV